jgi:hypothetical protein
MVTNATRAEALAAAFNKLFYLHCLMRNTYGRKLTIAQHYYMSKVMRRKALRRYTAEGN